jgi:hypothetical protein
VNTNLPPISGREQELQQLMRQRPPQTVGQQQALSSSTASTFACALHMHQPTIPAGADGALINHLQYMFEHPNDGDNHNAEPFAQCYRRMAELIPQLINEGCDPRIMLDYSGTLLWGIEQMGRHDISAALHHLACDPLMQHHVEWLGSFWGHAVASSTPIPDLKLHIQAWQHQFASCFGEAALQRVQGFSPPEMHLPNHPDVLHAFVAALKESGYRWLLVQEHSVENRDGSNLQGAQRFMPCQLVARNSHGAEARITALIKTQGSDTKLVGQMQPYSEALGLGTLEHNGHRIPALVSQIADGENGGVMMNEFPAAFLQAHRSIGERTGERKTIAVNGTEYLNWLEANGISETSFPEIQARHQQRIWERCQQPPSPEAVEHAIASLQEQDSNFCIDGASWTNNISWVQGYANVLEPMQQLSARFHAVFDPLVADDPIVRASSPYRQALLHLLLLETSCFRYWGQGTWTDHARELFRRGMALLDEQAQGDGDEPVDCKPAEA